MSYFSSFKSAVQTGVSAAWYGSGAGSVVEGARQVYDNAGSGGTWSGLAQGAARMVAGGAALYTLPSAPLRAAVAGLASNAFAPDAVSKSREAVGPLVKYAGKQTGYTALLETGRRIQYGHLSADRLFKEHPSEFLRQYAVQSSIQAPDDPGGMSNTRELFQFRTISASTSSFPSMNQITDSSGYTRQPRQHLQLIKAADAQQHVDVHGSTQVGNSFYAAFLPMLQARNDKLEGFRRKKELSKFSVQGLEQGRIRDRNLNRRGETIVVTTQLSGCSVTRGKGTLMHIRPKNDGRQLQETLESSLRQPSFGRKDYPGGQRAFVMVRKKPGGNTMLHYQAHDSGSNQIRSGKRRI